MQGRDTNLHEVLPVLEDAAGATKKEKKKKKRKDEAEVIDSAIVALPGNGGEEAHKDVVRIFSYLRF